MSQPTPNDADLVSRWPHRLAILLACATFPLIWVGGLVTTTDAGMAVPDWPNTYGYNLLLYPWQTWLFGPWDLMVEHGHRLLGVLAGALTIALVVVVWRFDRRPWMRRLVLGALLAVIAQGTLGGMRVLLDARRLAMVHAMVGPAFFTLTIALATLTSRRWLTGDAAGDTDRVGLSLFRLAALTTLFAYAQLTLGASVRHTPTSADPYQFRVVVVLHLIVAVVLVLHALLLSLQTVRATRRRSALRRGAATLLALLCVQLLLGAGTWITRFGWPEWTQSAYTAAAFTIQAGASFQTLIVTAHMAAGSLILATSFWLTLEVFRRWQVSRWRTAYPETTNATSHDQETVPCDDALQPTLKTTDEQDAPSDGQWLRCLWSPPRGTDPRSDRQITGGAGEHRV